MKRPVWRHDAVGFSGGWYPTKATRWQLTILGIYRYAYFLDVMAPLIGDVRLGFLGRESPDRRGLVYERQPRPE